MYINLFSAKTQVLAFAAYVVDSLSYFVTCTGYGSQIGKSGCGVLCHVHIQ